MYDGFLKVYDDFKKHEVENPLIETLRLFDILSKRAIQEIDLSIIEQNDIDISGLAQKRKKNTPIEYILGMAPFMGQMFYCSQDTLIPREETELLAKVALSLVKRRQKVDKNQTILDMGTGCGNIAISLALNSKYTKLLASDLNIETIETAQKNVDKFLLSDRVSLFNGDLFYPFKDLGYEGQIDMIVCNPPYIPTGSLKKMPAEIIENEPKEAFDAGPFGINFYRRLVKDSPLYLRSQGILVFEIGASQENLVTRILEKSRSYDKIEYFDDGEQIRAISAVCK